MLLCGAVSLCHFSDIVGYLLGKIFNSSTHEVGTVVK